MSAAPAEEAVKDAPPVKPEAEGAQDASDLFGGLKKKSKKKKIPMDLDAELSGVRIYGGAYRQAKEDKPEGGEAPAAEESGGAPADDTPLDVCTSATNDSLVI